MNDPNGENQSTEPDANPDPAESGPEKLPPALPEREPAPAWSEFAPPLPGQGQLSASEDRTWGMLCHLASFAGLLVPTLGNILGPLVVWLIKRNESPFVDAHGKESLNFQISMSIYLLLSGSATAICGFVLSFIFCFGTIATVVLGIALSLLAIFAIVYQIVASVRANEGGFLRYPITIRFFR